MLLAKYYKMTNSFNNTYGIQALVNFSFYGVKSLLVLYLTQDLGMATQEAIALCTGMIACSYLISLAGGFFASRLVPLKTCLLTSLSILNLGLFTLANSQQDQFLLFTGITLFVCGAGLFKPLVPLILDTLFTRRPEARERGFTVFYTILNVGSLFGFLICGFTSHSYGKSMGFLAASISAILALLTAYFSKFPPENTLSKSSDWKKSAYFGSVFLIICLLFLSINFMDIFKMMFPLMLVGILFIFLSIYIKAPDTEKKSILSCYLFAFFFALFAAIYEQTAGSLTLLLEQKINRSPFGLDSWISVIPTPAFHVLGPLFAILYTLTMGVRKNQSTPPTLRHYCLKISLGFLVVSFAFLALVVAISLYPGEEKAPLTWIILTYFCITIAEMSIVPICLSAITTFSPTRLKGPFVALWTLSIAYGTYFSGILVKFSSWIFKPISSATEQPLDFSSIFLIAMLLCLLVSFTVFIGTIPHFRSKFSPITSKI